MSTGFSPNFSNGGYWEYYKDLERQFENYLNYVPYLKGNENTYSFGLANLILAIGAHIDSAFKEIARYPAFAAKYPLILKYANGRTKKTTMWDYVALSEEYELPALSVFFKCLPSREIVKPFQDYKRTGTYNAQQKEIIQCPDWWNVYNEIKHKFTENFSKATLKTTRDTLAAAFLLNVVHIEGAYRLCQYGQVKDIVGNITIDCTHFQRDLIAKRKPWDSVETKIFVYLYHPE